MKSFIRSLMAEMLPGWFRATRIDDMNRMVDDKGPVPKRPGGGRPPQGKAVDDEDPDHSPMDDRGLAMPTGPAQPYDIDRMESDRMKSQGPEIKSRE